MFSPVVYVIDRARARDEDDIVNYTASVADTTKLVFLVVFLSPLQFLWRLAFRIPSLVSIVTLFPPLYKHVHYASPWIDVSQRLLVLITVCTIKRCSLKGCYYYFSSWGIIKPPCKICMITI